jgi:hypothetical protein
VGVPASTDVFPLTPSDKRRAAMTGWFRGSVSRDAEASVTSPAEVAPATSAKNRASGQATGGADFSD